MMFRDEPAGAASLLHQEMRRFVQLRWCAGVALALGAGAGRSLWPSVWGYGVALGAVVLFYNAVLAVLLRLSDPEGVAKPDGTRSRAWLEGLAWVQIVLDLICLAMVTAGTGGRCGPAAGLFVLHMVLSSMLLSVRQSYLVATLSVGFVGAALLVTGQMPTDSAEAVLWIGWAVVLFATCFLTGRITNDARRHHAAMRDRHEQLRAILETAIEGIITIDTRGLMLSANPAAERIFGYLPGELVGRRVNELMPEPDRSQHDGYLNNYLRTRQPKIIGIGREVVGLRKDGTRVPLDLSVSEVRVGQGIIFTGIVRDITERKRSEAELLAMNRSLQRHQQALIQNEKMVAMGQMAAGIVHEIGNPLASMDTLLQLVKRHPERLNAEAAVALREQVTRIHRIVHQLTDFAHPNETGSEIRKVNELVESTLEMMRFDRRLRGITVERQFAPQAGEVKVMVHLFQQVLVNMIANAVDAMADVANPRLVLSTCITASPNGPMSVISVEDNGHGIAPEHLPHVFEPFFTTKPIGRGTGLGLSISYSVIQRHGGECEVESQVGRGTTFRICLPTFTGPPS